MKTMLFLLTTIIGTTCIHGQIHQWTKGIIGTGNTAVHGKKTHVESSGNAIYSYGEHEDFDSENSVTFDPTGIAMELTGEFYSACYLIKTTPEGQLIWGQTFSASSYVFFRDLKTDAAGNCYVIGIFRGTMDVDNSSNESILDNEDPTSFIVKLNAAGEFVWAQQYENMEISSISIRSNALFCAGIFMGQCDFDNSPSSAQYSSQGLSDCFVLRLNTDGEYQWVKIIESPSPIHNEIITNISTTPTGGLNITGLFSNSTDFNPDAGVTTLTAIGEADIFVMQLNGIGDFQWAHSIGSNLIDNPTSLNTAPTGAIYLTGVRAQLTNVEPYEDILLIKFSDLGDLLWSKSIGGSNSDQAISSTIDENENLYVSGNTSSLDLDFDPGINEAYQAIDPTVVSIGYILKLNSDGNFVWVTSLNGTNNDIWSISYKNGALYTTGSFVDSIDMAPGDPFYQLNGNTQNHCSYLSKLDVTQTLHTDELDATQSLPFSLYPNPVQSFVLATVEIGSIVSIYDLSGAIVVQQTVTEQPTAINIESLNAGTYLVQVLHDGKAVNQKLVKY